MVTKEDFQEFAEFALPIISSGNARSMPQLVEQWEVQREHDETVKVLKRAYEDMKSGRGTPAEEVFSKIRRMLGVSQLCISDSNLAAGKGSIL